jgi:hypothetical protein
MLRLLAGLLLCLASAQCSEEPEDAATSERCKSVRGQWLMLKLQRDMLLQNEAERGIRSASAPLLEARMATLENGNWDCFH